MTNFFLLTLILTASFSGFAQDVVLGAGAKRELILQGKNCAELLGQREALCSWKKLIEPGFVPTKESYTCSVTNGKARLAVLNCLPTFAKAHHRQKLLRSGPNCWGTAMSFKKLSLKPRFMWPEEMDYWISSNVCRKLDVGEPRLPGDIINVYAPEYVFGSELKENDMGTRFSAALYPGRSQPVSSEGYSGFHRLLHSVTYITDKLAFGKDSPSKDDPFFFHPMDQVYGRPQETECQENQSLSPHVREYNNSPREIRGSRCAYFSTVHRCESFPTYFSKLSLSTDDLNKLEKIQSLQEIQTKLFPLTLSLSTGLPNAEIARIVKQADETMANTRDELKNVGNDKNREMLLTLEYFSAAALRKSLEQARLIPATEPL